MWEGPRAACAQLPIDAGAAVDQAAQDGATPLHIACLDGHVACLQLHTHYSLEPRYGSTSTSRAPRAAQRARTLQRRRVRRLAEPEPRARGLDARLDVGPRGAGHGGRRAVPQAHHRVKLYF